MINRQNGAEIDRSLTMFFIDDSFTLNLVSYMTRYLWLMLKALPGLAKSLQA
jgi:hypothetical protein